ncbi:MAG TPA: hypothetical protein VK777_31195 [Reyranella sp.]|jgi:hypothetical protein|nr:hypothetical protein [Reyranella sp.]
MSGAGSDFQRLLARDIGNEKRILWSEIAVVAAIALLGFVYVFAW